MQTRLGDGRCSFRKRFAWRVFLRRLSTRIDQAARRHSQDISNITSRNLPNISNICSQMTSKVTSQHLPNIPKICTQITSQSLQKPPQGPPKTSLVAPLGAISGGSPKKVIFLHPFGDPKNPQGQPEIAKRCKKTFPVMPFCPVRVGAPKNVQFRTSLDLLD